MTGRVRVIVAAASLVVVLTGCSAHEPPPPYTGEQLDTYFEHRLDAAWENTDLAGEVERPRFDGRAVDRFAPGNHIDLTDCIFDSGMTEWGWNEENGGPAFVGATSEALEPEAQLIAYSCFAAFPVSDNFRDIMLTDDQKNYLYDYYKSWVVPCLVLHDYELDYIPGRDLYLNEVGDWNPYYSIVGGPGFSRASGLTSELLLELTELCGAPYADLDVEVGDPFGAGG